MKIVGSMIVDIGLKHLMFVVFLSVKYDVVARAAKPMEFWTTSECELRVGVIR